MRLKLLIFFSSLSLLKEKNPLCVCVLCLHVRMCTICVLGACGGQKAPDLLQLELRKVVSRCVGSGTQTQDPVHARPTLDLLLYVLAYASRSN